jgi:GntR family transcriptional regulator
MAGVYVRGEKIPTESELCNEFNTSRITIRQALKILEEQGMLIRKQGIGTLVSEKIILQPINFNGYVEDIIFQLLPARIIEFNKQEIEPSNEIRQLLTLSEHVRTVTQLKRVRAIDDEPNSYALNYLPNDIGEGVTEELVYNHSLIEIIDQMGDRIQEVTQTIKAAVADESVAKNLNINIGDPVLYVEYMMVNRDKRLLNYAKVYYHAERYRYTVKMGRLTPGE